MIIRKAVIPAAGLGTRLLPVTKELPKEMLPVFDKEEGNLAFKPLIQIIFERLYQAGIREFCIITGRGKRALIDYFSRDEGYLELLNAYGKGSLREKLEKFYRTVESSTLFWINQPKPTGLGAAVALAESFVGIEPFIVHAGDTYIASNNYIKTMTRAFEKLKPDALFLTARVEDPKSYGIIEKYEIEDEKTYRIYRVVEKPKEPKTNMAIVPIYVLTPKIFKALRNIEPGTGGELQLTDAIQILAEKDKVYAIELENSEDYIDIGKAENYLRALIRSYNLNNT